MKVKYGPIQVGMTMRLHVPPGTSRYFNCGGRQDRLWACGHMWPPLALLTNGVVRARAEVAVAGCDWMAFLLGGGPTRVFLIR